MYHKISRGQVDSQWSVSLEAFQNQLNFLQHNHFHVITMDELIKHVKKRKKLSSKSVVLTFDDGTEDFYYLAFPELSRLKYPAVIFLVASEIGQDGKLKKWQIDEMLGTNLITIGNHTNTHPELDKLDNQSFFRELLISQLRLGELFGVKPKYLAYPYGLYNDQVIEIARGLGFVAAFGAGGKNVCSEPDSLFKRARTYVGEGKLELYL